MPASITPGPTPQVFPQTRWSVVLAATGQPSPGAADALETLCRLYWPPLYAFVRRSGHAPQDAQDMTQEFFCRLLEKRWLDSVDPHKGKLRTFLIVMLKNFMRNEWRRASTQRRGGSRAHFPFDTAAAESRYTSEPPALAADQTYDRQWALTLLELTVNRLREEFAATGRTADFEALKGCLLAERGAIDYAALAERLNATEPAARIAVHRLRKRFRQVYRQEMAQTLADGADLDEELRYLAAALVQQKSEPAV